MATESKDLAASGPIVLLVALEPATVEFLKPLLKGVTPMTLTGEQAIKLIDEPLKSEPILTVVGPDLKDPGALEVAQTLRMLWPQKPLFYVTEHRRDYEEVAFKKNGFKDTFALAVDTHTLKANLMEILSKITGAREYKSVKLLDIQANTSLDFDTHVYLPANNKYVIFSRASEVLRKEQVDRLKTHKMTSVFVPLEQMPKFYEYSAKALQNLGSDSSLSETERRDRLYSSIRGLFTGIVGNTKKDGSFSAGKELLADCSKIVESFILQSPSKSIYAKIQSIVGESSDHYSHASNTSTIAALFSMGLGLGNPEHLAVAGLLHDIGLAAVPLEIQMKPEKERTPAEQEEYQKHVSATIDMIKAQKLILPDLALKAVMQHHEKFNTTGYPKGLPGSKITIEAQLLAIADRFEELTSVEAGKARLTPVEAIQFFTKEVAQDLNKLWYDPKLMTKVLALLSAENQPTS